MIGISSRGDFKKTKDYINRLLGPDIYSSLDQYGRMGVDALANATPIDTGDTANAWGYRVIRDKQGVGIEWFNTSLTRGGTPVVILLQYGHGTGTGGYVQGHDFINPAITPIFEAIANEVWKEVNR